MDVLIYKRLKITKSHMHELLIIFTTSVMVNFVFRIHRALLTGMYIYTFRTDN